MWNRILEKVATAALVTLSVGLIQRWLGHNMEVDEEWMHMEAIEEGEEEEEEAPEDDPDATEDLPAS